MPAAATVTVAGATAAAMRESPTGTALMSDGRDEGQDKKAEKEERDARNVGAVVDNEERVGLRQHLLRHGDA